MSLATSHLRTHISGHTTPGMHTHDVGAAHVVAQQRDAIKAKALRYNIRTGLEGAYHERGREEIECRIGDLITIGVIGFQRVKDAGGKGSRRLRVVRLCGWLSCVADPETTTLVRRDELPWFRGREDELREDSHRHPQVWRHDGHEWHEGGDTRNTDYTQCGSGVNGGWGA